MHLIVSAQQTKCDAYNITGLFIERVMGKDLANINLIYFMISPLLSQSFGCCISYNYSSNVLKWEYNYLKSQEYYISFSSNSSFHESPY